MPYGNLRKKITKLKQSRFRHDVIANCFIQGIKKNIQNLKGISKFCIDFVIGVRLSGTF